MARIRPVAKSRLRPGVVVWAHILFEETDGDKLRPAVVQATRGRDVSVLPATSAVNRNRYPGRYHELQDLEAAGLWRPTGVRRTAVTVDPIQILHIVGELSEADADALIGPVDFGAARRTRATECALLFAS